jgi:hypothetical protein
MYRYKLIHNNAGSERYGACGVCKKRADTIYHQTEERYFEFYDEVKNQHHRGWTQHNCFDIWGHKECCESRQREPKADYEATLKHNL